MPNSEKINRVGAALQFGIIMFAALLAACTDPICKIDSTKIVGSPYSAYQYRVESNMIYAYPSGKYCEPIDSIVYPVSSDSVQLIPYKNDLIIATVSEGVALPNQDNGHLLTMARFRPGVRPLDTLPVQFEVQTLIAPSELNFRSFSYNESSNSGFIVDREGYVYKLTDGFFFNTDTLGVVDELSWVFKSYNDVLDINLESSCKEEITQQLSSRRFIRAFESVIVISSGADSVKIYSENDCSTYPSSGLYRATLPVQLRYE